MYTPADGVLAFIDLEQTIIAAWNNPTLINVSRIRKFLKENNISEVGIFSYAIYDDLDKQQFASEIKQDIEEALGVTVTTWPSVFDMAVLYDNSKKRNKLDLFEFISDHTKEASFKNYVLNKYVFKRAILIDDLVSNITLTHRQQGWSIEYWDVNLLGR